MGGVIETGTDKLSPIKIEYVTLEFTSTMVTRKPVGIKQPLYDMMEEVVKKIIADAPVGLKFCDQDFGFRGWVWMETEKALVNGLFNGLYICFPIAFAVLALATRNGPLALVATIAIGCIVASVLGFVKCFNGWDLGIAETIAGIIVIGFSVDYVVHMGHMYIEAAEKSGAMKREDRFYYKMAVLITLTIGFSFVYSFGFFMAYLIMIGPEYESGYLGFICGSSLINEANEAVEARKNAVALWKKFKLKAIADGTDSSNNSKKSKKSNQKMKQNGTVAIEMSNATIKNEDEIEELTGKEILNWGGQKTEQD